MLIIDISDKMSSFNEMTEFSRLVNDAVVKRIGKEVVIKATGGPYRFNLISSQVLPYEKEPGWCIGLDMYSAGFAQRYYEALSYFEDVVSKIVEAIKSKK